MVHVVPDHLCGLWSGRALRRLALGAVCSAALVLGAQAAALQDPVDVLQAQDSTLPAAAGKTLERALSIDTSSSQRNLELLLETRSSATDAPARGGEAPARRPALPMALVPTTVDAAGAPPPPLPLGLQSNEAATEPSTTMRREWLGAGPSGQASAAFGMAPVGAETGPARADRADGEDPALRRLFTTDAVQFLRDNRFLLLGGLALVAALAAGLQAYVRRA